MKWRRISVWSLFWLSCIMGCEQDTPEGDFILATTTSTYDSGLLNELLPSFEKQHSVKVKVIAVGSGQALKMGELGEADALLVHSPAAEERFMKSGCGASRSPVMHNYFVLTGPPDNATAFQNVQSVSAAFVQIAREKAPFVSRGDDSGTHAREKQIWSHAGVEPHGDWYIESGQGMAATLRMASEKRAYTLTDLGTFLANKRILELEVLLDEDPLLKNPYHVIVVSQKCGKHVRQKRAQQFVEFLTSEQTQYRIAHFSREKAGRSLFVPDVHGSEPQ